MKWVVHRPVATWMITIAMFVFGVVSYQRLPLNLMPDLSYPTITIKTEADGYAPEEVEDQISRRIEEAVSTTQGIANLESRSRAGSSEVLLSFHWGHDINDAIQDVRERLQRIFFEADVQRPLILRYDPSVDPILRLALSKPGQDNQNLSQLRETARRIIKRDLEAMDGVAAVRIRGGVEQEAQVLIKENWLAARGLTIENITQTLEAENINIPGGSILEGDREYLVRTLNAFRHIEDLHEIKIRRADGVSIPLSEVAEIRNGFKDRSVMSRIDSSEAVELEVFKASDANIVTVAAMLKSRINGNPLREQKGLRDELPDGIRLTILEDQARFIEAALMNLRSTALIGAFFAIIVLFVFLRDFRSTVIISAAIPLSVVVSFAPMYIYDVSLNLMSLGGLALGIGMLVDNAVVVLENIQVFLEKGHSRKEAASKGSSEIAMAVTASTLTSISVFLPIAFVEGVAGQIFSDLALSVVFSLLASLVVALFFVPMLAASDFKLPQTTEQPTLRNRFQAFQEFKTDWKQFSGARKWVWLLWGSTRFLMNFSWQLVTSLILMPLLFCFSVSYRLGSQIVPPCRDLLLRCADSFYRYYESIESQYTKTLKPILQSPARTVTFAILLLLLSIPIARTLGQTLLPELKQGRFAVDLTLPIGTPLGRTASRMLAVEQDIAKMSNVSYVYAILGADTRSDERSGAGEHSARLLIGTESGSDEDALMAQVRQRCQSIKDIQDIQLSRPALFSFDTPIELVIYATNLMTLKELAGQTKKILSGLPILADVRSSLSAGYPEIQIQYDRDRLRQLGITSSVAARIVKEKIQGKTTTNLSSGEARLPLTVRLIESDRRNITQLKQININPNVNPPIPLSTVANFEVTEGPSEIRRIDQQRAVVISANVEGFDLSGPATAIAQSMQNLDAEWEITGQSEEMRASMESMQFALLLAIFLVYVIMASTFESILHPFVILFSVPMASIGVVLTLMLLQIPLSVIVLIGAIVLAGVVVNNAIVLVDTINRKRDAGDTRVEATLAAARLRIRPILITTLTTALGLFPLALGFGEGSEIQQPLAITIIAGLLSSTVLTLLIIPSVYLLFTSTLERKS